MSATADAFILPGGIDLADADWVDLSARSSSPRSSSPARVAALGLRGFVRRAVD